jgi:hypothetical protein
MHDPSRVQMPGGFMATVARCRVGFWSDSDAFYDHKIAAQP